MNSTSVPTTNSHDISVLIIFTVWPICLGLIFCCYACLTIICQEERDTESSTQLPSENYKEDNPMDLLGDSSSGESSDSECTICLRAISLRKAQPNRTYVVETSCGHHFHRHCLIEWKKKQLEVFTCPICRSYLPTHDQDIIDSN